MQIVACFSCKTWCLGLAWDEWKGIVFKTIDKPYRVEGDFFWSVVFGLRMLLKNENS